MLTFPHAHPSCLHFPAVAVPAWANGLGEGCLSGNLVHSPQGLLGIQNGAGGRDLSTKILIMPLLRLYV